MRILAISLALLALATPAFAGPVTLKPDTFDADGVVTLGELFEGAGAAAKVPVATRSTSVVILDAYAVQAAARRAGLDWANAEGIRRIVVRAAGSGAGGVASATAPRGNVDVLTYSRSLAAGEMVQPTDLVWGKAAAAPADAPRDADAVIGLVAKRPLREGAVVSARDVAAAQVVKMGEAVTVTWDADGVSLAMQAKAMTGGAVGDTITVQNLNSKKILQAVVSGPGQAAVGPAAAELKSTRYALR
jgi:flagella basal body P-ring formation protein FlgA